LLLPPLFSPFSRDPLEKEQRGKKRKFPPFLFFPLSPPPLPSSMPQNAAKTALDTERDGIPFFLPPTPFFSTKRIRSPGSKIIIVDLFSPSFFPFFSRLKRASSRYSDHTRGFFFFPLLPLPFFYSIVPKRERNAISIGGRDGILSPFFFFFFPFFFPPLPWAVE